MAFRSFGVALAGFGACLMCRISPQFFCGGGSFPSSLSIRVIHQPPLLPPPPIPLVFVSFSPLTLKNLTTCCGSPHHITFSYDPSLVSPVNENRAWETRVNLWESYSVWEDSGEPERKGGEIEAGSSPPSRPLSISPHPHLRGRMPTHKYRRGGGRKEDNNESIREGKVHKRRPSSRLPCDSF